MCRTSGHVVMTASATPARNAYSSSLRPIAGERAHRAVSDAPARSARAAAPFAVGVSAVAADPARVPACEACGRLGAGV